MDEEKTADEIIGEDTENDAKEDTDEETDEIEIAK